jgi:hypothetical protein
MKRSKETRRVSRDFTFSFKMMEGGKIGLISKRMSSRGRGGRREGMEG